jgi:hypothetical protein
VNISNGGTVTAITRTASGSGYTSFPSIAISAPTTAGGVQSIGTINSMGANAATVQSGGTGYTNGDVLTLVGGTPSTSAATFTVNGVSGGVITSVSSTNFAPYTVIPTSPVSVTGGTGSGATLNVTYYVNSILNISNAGSGYVEQPTVTFSGGGGSGAAAYATVGAEPTIKSLFGGATTSGLAVATSGGTQVKFVDASDGTRPIHLYGGGAGGAGGFYQPLSGGLTYSANSGVHSFYTNGRQAGEQMRVSVTASAVNYVQVTGAATGSGPTISAQGSDAAINLVLLSKGGNSVVLQTRGGGTQRTAFLANDSGSNSVNYLQTTSNNAGSAPILSAQGSDTDIQLSLVPKGLGIVLMNQQTPAAVTATGTLTIANLLTQIITSTSATAVALTLPTGTLSDAGVSGGTSAVNTSFDYSIINTGSAVGDVTLVAGTGHTIVGSVSVPVGTTGRFRCRKTATNTFVSYRV